MISGGLFVTQRGTKEMQHNGARRCFVLFVVNNLEWVFGITRWFNYVGKD